MAATPILRASIRKVREIAEERGTTPEDFLTKWWADGGTYGTLAKLLGRSDGLAWKVVNANKTWLEAVNIGRRLNADRLAGEAMSIVDSAAGNPALTSPQAQIVREQVNTRKWLAAVHNPKDYAPGVAAAAATNVTVNVQQLHLHALLQPGALPSEDGAAPDMIDVTPDEQ
jgi:hypothetical protein